MAHVRTLVRKDESLAYEVRWREGSKFRQRTFTNKRQAERFALKMEGKLEEGQSTVVDVRRGKTVAQIVEASLAASKPKLKPRTYLSYVQNYDNHVLPEFSKRRISTLTSEDVERWVRGLSEKGLSPASVRNNFVALNKACKYALRHGHIAKNPCTGTALPVADVEEEFVAQILTPAQVEKLADHMGGVEGLIVRTFAYGGLRAGELTGLRVRDVNLLRKQIEVRLSVQHIDGERVVVRPKSKRSNREVPILMSRLHDDLRAHLDSHPLRHDGETGLWPGSTRGNRPEPTYEQPFAFSTFYKHFKLALRTCKLPDIRVHDLRHTAASMWLAAGIPPYKVSRWLGHANLTTTDSIYGHLYPGDHSAEAALLDAFVGNPSATPPTALRRAEPG